MIAYLKGTIIDKNQNPLILSVHDVGYAVSVPDHTRAEATLQSRHEFFIYTYMKDSTIELFGFQAKNEHRLFTLLLTVSGVGPKIALSVIDRGVEMVQRAIMEADIDFFTTVPRLGKKNAQKIIIELKNKLGSSVELDLSDSPSENQDVLSALLSMGFERRESIEVLQKLDKDISSVEDKLKSALKILGKS